VSKARNKAGPFHLQKWPLYVIKIQTTTTTTTVQKKAKLHKTKALLPNIPLYLILV